MSSDDDRPTRYEITNNIFDGIGYRLLEYERKGGDLEDANAFMAWLESEDVCGYGGYQFEVLFRILKDKINTGADPYAISFQELQR